MQITKGKIVSGERFVVYGPEGIGKSTFVSRIPGVVFIDTEGSTNNMDVPRLPRPTSWTMLMGEVDDALKSHTDLNALVIDTADWAERLCVSHVLATNNWKSIEEPGYGRGYVVLAEEFGKLLNKLSDLTEKGVHAGFTAHSMMRKFEQPDELGAYDRWELKMSKKVAPLVKEWASIMLFANYKTLVYSADKDGKKHKASGGQRVMYASHHPCWDAKNRHGLPDEMPFDFAQVAGILGPVTGETAPMAAAQEVLPIPAGLKAAPEEREEEVTVDYSMVPGPLADLMKRDGVSPFEVQAAVAQKGYFPMGTDWANYPQDFIDGVLIGAWEQVKEICLENGVGLPFRD